MNWLKKWQLRRHNRRILRDAERETRGMTPAQRHTWRLNRLAKILQNLPPEKFDMAIWGMHLGIDHIPSQETNYCGTTACALGHAAMDPVFNAQGLTHEWYQAGDEETLRSLPPARYEMQIMLNGEHSDSYDSYKLGAEFFGLTDDEAYAIFMSIDSSQANVIEKLHKYATNREEIQ